MGETSFDKTQIPSVSLNPDNLCLPTLAVKEDQRAEVAGSALMFADHIVRKQYDPLAYKRLILEIRTLTYPSWLLTRDVEMDMLLAGG